MSLRFGPSKTVDQQVRPSFDAVVPGFLACAITVPSGCAFSRAKLDLRAALSDDSPHVDQLLAFEIWHPYEWVAAFAPAAVVVGAGPLGSWWPWRWLLARRPLPVPGPVLPSETLRRYRQRPVEPFAPAFRALRHNLTCGLDSAPQQSEALIRLGLKRAQGIGGRPAYDVWNRNCLGPLRDVQPLPFRPLRASGTVRASGRSHPTFAGSRKTRSACSP